MANPLVTFALFAYNQEKFIREAVEGAFAQSYSPLEIILSDDCSTDRTFEIIQDMAGRYHGKHVVRLNRTNQNKGLAVHVNSVMALADGELVVFAAGDDYSLPHRVEMLTSEWIRSGKPSGIGSGLRNIDERGKLLESSAWASELIRLLKNTSRDQLLHQFMTTHEFTLAGCCAAWSMATWNKFGPLMETGLNEDDALTFRSILDRGLHVVEEPLVLYRRHTNNMWNTGLLRTCTPAYYRSSEEKVVKQATMNGLMFQNSLSDLKTAVSRNLLDAAIAKILEADAFKMMRRLEIQAKWWDLPVLKRLSLFSNSPHRSFPLNLISLLPLNQHAALRCMLSKIKSGLIKKHNTGPASVCQFSDRH